MNAIYGIVKPSLIDVNKDVDIYYHYRRSRTSDDPSFRKFRKIQDPTIMLSGTDIADSDIGDMVDSQLPGMFRLNLPLSIFSRKGIYTIYIKPREYKTLIADIGTLQSYPDIRGVVVNESNMPSNLKGGAPDSLVGYAISYFSDGSRDDVYRIVTSSNRCSVSTEQLNNPYQQAPAYRYNDGGTLWFLTVTPSSRPDFKTNALPYIGTPGQTITLSNTKFDPVMVEVEIVDHDIETVSVMLEGEQVRNLENGRVTHYNFDGEIYKQFEFSTVKDNYTTSNVAEVKLDKSGNIDTSLDIQELRDA